jgi:hypothetical protein
MEDETQVTPETLEGNEIQEAEQAIQAEESVEEIKTRLAKAEELAENYKIRAEKAERSKPKQQEKGLSDRDVIYLAKADIHEEDTDEVVAYAHKMGVSVSEAHKFYQPILRERNEFRLTAQATQTKGGRGTNKTTGEDLLQRAERTGEVPTDDAGIYALAQARMDRRNSAKQR